MLPFCEVIREPGARLYCNVDLFLCQVSLFEILIGSSP